MSKYLLGLVAVVVAIAVALLLAAGIGTANAEPKLESAYFSVYTPVQSDVSNLFEGSTYGNVMLSVNGTLMVFDNLGVDGFMSVPKNEITVYSFDYGTSVFGRFSSKGLSAEPYFSYAANRNGSEFRQDEWSVGVRVGLINRR